MDRIARASTDERRLVFEAAARRMALAPAVVEKDFWVCYTLDHLFHRSGFAESMVFKGGTSLSKAFGLIERFSEDIDLILAGRPLARRAPSYGPIESAMLCDWSCMTTVSR